MSGWNERDYRSANGVLMLYDERYNLVISYYNMIDKHWEID